MMPCASSYRYTLQSGMEFKSWYLESCVQPYHIDRSNQKGKLFVCVSFPFCPLYWCFVDTTVVLKFLKGNFFGFFSLLVLQHCIQHCFICRPSDSTISEDAGIESRTGATTALAFRRSNHSARSHPLSARSHPHSARSHPLSARSHPHSARSYPLSARSHPHSARSHQHSAISHPHSARSHPVLKYTRIGIFSFTLPF